MTSTSPTSSNQSEGTKLGALRGRRVSGWGERLIEITLWGCGVLSVLITLGILYVLATQTIAFFAEVSIFDYLADTEWTPLFAEARFGVWPLISGTMLTTLIAMAVALPFGLLAAIYLSEFATPRARSIFKPLLEVLAGVPTIVYGYFALVTVTPILQIFIPGLQGFNALSAGLVMGIMIIPMISSLSEDALSALPRQLRESAHALGIGPVKTILFVSFPAARSGIVAAVTLAVSRAIGETMIVAVAAGQMAQLTMDPRESVQTMTAYIVQVSMGDVPTGTLEYRTIFVVGATLFAMTFTMNLIGQHFARKVRHR